MCSCDKIVSSWSLFLQISRGGDEFHLAYLRGTGLNRNTANPYCDRVQSPQAIQIKSRHSDNISMCRHVMCVCVFNIGL